MVFLYMKNDLTTAAERNKKQRLKQTDEYTQILKYHIFL